MTLNRVKFPKPINRYKKENEETVIRCWMYKRMFSTYLYFLFLYCVYAYQYMMPDDICDLIDIKYVKYTFQCGEVSCEGPLHYCSDDNVCLYCSMDLCQSPSPPDQCQLQCKKLQLEIIKGKIILSYIILLRLYSFILCCPCNNLT